MITEKTKLSDALWYVGETAGSEGQLTVIDPGPLFSAADQRGNSLLCTAADSVQTGGIAVLRRELPERNRSILIAGILRNRFFRGRGPVLSGCTEGIYESGLAAVLRPAGHRQVRKCGRNDIVPVILDRCSGITEVGAVLETYPGIADRLKDSRLFLADRSGRYAEIVFRGEMPEVCPTSALQSAAGILGKPEGAMSRTHAGDLLQAIPVPDGAVRQIRIYDCTDISVLVYSAGESYEFSPLRQDPKQISGRVFRPASRIVRDAAGAGYRNTYEKDLN